MGDAAATQHRRIGHLIHRTIFKTMRLEVPIVTLDHLFHPISPVLRVNGGHRRER